MSRQCYAARHRTSCSRYFEPNSHYALRPFPNVIPAVERALVNEITRNCSTGRSPCASRLFRLSYQREDVAYLVVRNLCNEG